MAVGMHQRWLTEEDLPMHCSRTQAHVVWTSMESTPELCGSSRPYVILIRGRALESTPLINHGLEMIQVDFLIVDCQEPSGGATEAYANV